jgi:hypothetical protein
VFGTRHSSHPSRTVAIYRSKHPAALHPSTNGVWSRRQMVHEQSRSRAMLSAARLLHSSSRGSWIAIMLKCNEPSTSASSRSQDPVSPDAGRQCLDLSEALDRWWLPEARIRRTSYLEGLSLKVFRQRCLFLVGGLLYGILDTGQRTKDRLGCISRF